MPKVSNFGSLGQGVFGRENGFDANFLHKSSKPDVISEMFQIKLDQKLTEKDTEFAQAFEVQKLVKESFYSNELYALVFETQLPVRLQLLHFLHKHKIPNLANVIDCGITTISLTNKQHIVVIVEKTKLPTLRQYIASKRNVTSNFIINKIIAPMTAILTRFQQHELCHGNINPDTIYYNEETSEILLAEPISQLCGYKQLPVYETLERSEIIPIAKGEGNITIDYHALGVTCIFLLTGKDPAESDVNKKITNLRYEEGSFSAIVGNITIPSTIYLFIYSVINDYQASRWKSENIEGWLNGEQIYSKKHGDHNASRAILFNQKGYLNPQSLANALWKYWDLTPEFLHDNRLLKWIDNDLGNSDITGKLDNLINANLHKKNASENFITKALLILDPNGPIRIKNYAIMEDGFGYLIAQGVRGNQLYLDVAAKIINHDIQIKVNSAAYDKGSDLQPQNKLYDPLKYVLHLHIPGFGMTRIFYDYNPFLSCQSPILNGEYINTVEELLNYLNKNADRENFSVIDDHIVAFCASRIGVNEEYLTRCVTKVAKHDSIISLAILANAQKSRKMGALRNLCQIFVAILLPSASNLNSKSAQNKLMRDLLEASASGDLGDLLRIITDQNRYNEDQQNLEKARKRLSVIEDKITQNKKSNKIYENGYNYGLIICLAFSYIICAIVFTFQLRDLF